MKKFRVAVLLFCLCAAARGGEPAKIAQSDFPFRAFSKMESDHGCQSLLVKK